MYPFSTKMSFLMFLLSNTSILRFNKWFTNCDTVKVAFPLSVHNVVVDNQTGHWGSFSLTKDFNFYKLSWISQDVELWASFVPICIIILVGFFRNIGMIWWLKSFTAEPGKRLALTSLSFLPLYHLVWSHWQWLGFHLATDHYLLIHHFQ